MPKIHIANNFSENIYVIVTTPFGKMKIGPEYPRLRTLGERLSIRQLNTLNKTITDPLLRQEFRSFLLRLGIPISQRTYQSIKDSASSDTLDLFTDIFDFKWLDIFSNDYKDYVDVLVVSENHDSAIRFVSKTDQSWAIGKTGARRSFDNDLQKEDRAHTVYFWNGGKEWTGLRTNASPKLIKYNGKIWCLYRDGNNEKHNNGILYAEVNHLTFTHKGYLQHDAANSIAAVERGDGLLEVFVQHSVGTQLNSIICKEFSGTLQKQSFHWHGTDMWYKPSAARLNGVTCVLSMHNPGNAILWNTIEDGQRGSVGMDTGSAPHIVTYKGQFHLYYRSPGDNSGIFHATSDNGKQWTWKGYIGHHTSQGVTSCVLNDRLYLLYRDPNGNGILYTISDDGHNFITQENPYTGISLDSEPECIAYNNGILIMGVEAPQKDYSDDMMWLYLDFSKIG